MGGPVRSGPGGAGPGRPPWVGRRRPIDKPDPAGPPAGRPSPGPGPISTPRARYRSVFITRNIVPIEFVAQVANETAGSCHAEVTRGENFQELAI